ncbi:MAG: hydrogenase nickel incorporation protein HypB [Thermodesulfobacteriota bacterium]
MKIPVVRNILEANDRIAEELRKRFLVQRILVLNLISSPGSGKTSTLERTLTDLKDEFKMAVIEGDITTDNDARRVAATGAQAVQINTDGACHLDSVMVLEALNTMDLTGLDILFVENVGNLVCPAEFTVGEDAKVALLSVAEGDDKPEKYPLLFAEAQVMLLNKVDLLPYVDFDLDRAARHARALNKDIEVFPISCRTRDGLDAWYDWLRAAVKAKKASAKKEE